MDTDMTPGDIKAKRSMPGSNQPNDKAANALEHKASASSVMPSSSSEDGQSSASEMKKKEDAPAKVVPYRDYSQERPDTIEKEGAQNFPMKLHAILSNPEFQDIIAWLPHGRAWRILQHKAFEERVIPLYFRHGRYSSFARQVNGWNFRRITSGPDYNSYFHEMFLRGKPHLCRKMKRVTAKDAKKVENDADAPVPDFYAISREFPLAELPGFRGSGSDSEGGAKPQANGQQAQPNAAFRLLEMEYPKQQQQGSQQPAQGSGHEGEIAALERRRQELLQCLSALQGGGQSVPQPQQPQGQFAGLQQPTNMGGIPNHLLAALRGMQQAANPTQAPPQAPPGVNWSQLLAGGLPPGVDLSALFGKPAQAPQPPAPPQPQAPPPSVNLSQLLAANNNSGSGTNIGMLLQQLQGQIAGNQNFQATAANPAGAPQQQQQQQPPAQAPPPGGLDMAALQRKIFEAANASGGNLNPDALAQLLRNNGVPGPAPPQQQQSSAPAPYAQSNMMGQASQASSNAPAPQAPSSGPSSAPTPADLQRLMGGNSAGILEALQRQLMGGGMPQQQPPPAPSAPQGESSNQAPAPNDMQRQMLQSQLANNPQLAAALGFDLNSFLANRST